MRNCLRYAKTNPYLRNYTTMQIKKDILMYDKICRWLSSPNVNQVMQPMSDDEKDVIGELLDELLVLEQGDKISVKKFTPLFAFSKMKKVSCCNFNMNNYICLDQFIEHIIHFPKNDRSENDRSEKQWNLVHHVENTLASNERFFLGKRRRVHCSDSINFFARLLKLEDLSKQLLSLCFCSHERHNDLLHYAILTNAFRHNQCKTYEQRIINALHAGDLDFLYEAQNIDFHPFPKSIIDFHVDKINNVLH